MSFSDEATNLRDILESSEAIGYYLAGLTYQVYEADRKTRKAVERELQILSEAAYRLGDRAAVLCPTIDWRGVQGLGNFLRHEYNKVEDETIWEISHTKLPELREAVLAAVRAIEKPVPEDVK